MRFNTTRFDTMKFNVKAQSNILEIDLTDMVSTINNIKIQSTTKKIKTEFEMRKYLKNSTKRLLLTDVHIKIKKYENSLNAEGRSIWRLVERMDWIYLVFWANSWANRHFYNIRLIDKLDYSFTKKMLCFWKYEIVTDDIALRDENMYATLSNWVTKYTYKSLWTNISLKILWVLSIFAWLFVFWVAHAFAFFR